MSAVAGRLLARATGRLSTVRPELKEYEQRGGGGGNYSAELIGTSYGIAVRPEDLTQAINRLRLVRVKMMRDLRIPIMTINIDVGAKTGVVSVFPRPFVKNNPTPDDVQRSFNAAVSGA